MDHNYIPHENTGHTTHKYRVLIEDAEKFKFRMDNEIGFLAELNGMFSNRTEWHPRPLIEVTEENCEAFSLWLEKEWAEFPDALPTQTAAELMGHNPQSIHKLIKENVLHGVKIGAVQYIPKIEFISYLASPKKLATYRKSIANHTENIITFNSFIFCNNFYIVLYNIIFIFVFIIM